MTYFLIAIVPVEGISSKTHGMKLSAVLSSVERIVIANTTASSLRFKVIGQNKVILIAENNEVQKIMDQLNEEVEGLVNVTTTLLRTYESLARDLLGVDKSLCDEQTSAFKNPQRLFYVEAYANNPDMGITDFLKHWKEEAESVLIPRSKGQIDFCIFKPVTAKGVALFFNMPNPEAVDAAVFGLPFAKHPRISSTLYFPAVHEIQAL